MATKNKNLKSNAENFKDLEFKKLGKLADMFGKINNNLCIEKDSVYNLLNKNKIYLGTKIEYYRYLALKHKKPEKNNLENKHYIEVFYREIAEV